jgi:hypothetical protein
MEPEGLQELATGPYPESSQHPFTLMSALSFIFSSALRYCLIFFVYVGIELSLLIALQSKNIPG